MAEKIKLLDNPIHKSLYTTKAFCQNNTGGELMDIFQEFISNDYESLPRISDVFKQAEELKYILGTKSYILDHYISMFFHLIAKIDIVGLQDEASEKMANIMNSISDSQTENILSFQEEHTRQILFLLSNADKFLNKALDEFIEKKSFEFGSAVDIVDLSQTEEKLTELIGIEKMKCFKEMLLMCFLSCSLCSFFLISMSAELARRFITRDIETDMEIFRLYLNKFATEKNG